MEVNISNKNYRESLRSREMELNDGRQRLLNLYKRNQIASIIMVVLGIIIIVLSAFLPSQLKEQTQLSARGIVYTMMAGIGLGLLIVWFGALQILYKLPKIALALNQIDSELAILSEELEFQNIDFKEYEKRAEIQFRNHQQELKRYYDINLGHLKWVFPVGIGTIIAGVGIIVLSIILFRDVSNENVVLILIGTASGILIDFVGAIFIKMYMETIKASTEFHNKLIHSNDNLFANVLATKITDENLKNETFSEMAKIIARGQPEMKESKDNN